MVEVNFHCVKSVETERYDFKDLGMNFKTLKFIVTDVEDRKLEITLFSQEVVEIKERKKV